MSSIFDRDVREKFRGSGYVLTAQRRTVLRALRKAKGHPSVQDFYLVVKEDNPRVALGKAYQALPVLEETGLIEAKH